MYNQNEARSVCISSRSLFEEKMAALVVIDIYPGYNYYVWFVFSCAMLDLFCFYYGCSFFFKL